MSLDNEELKESEECGDGVILNLPEKDFEEQK